jgi:hypothetical protein
VVEQDRSTRFPAAKERRPLNPYYSDNQDYHDWRASRRQPDVKLPAVSRRAYASTLAAGCAFLSCWSNGMEDEARCIMKTIKATWTNGQIVPAEPVDWPEGAQLRVEPADGDAP